VGPLLSRSRIFRLESLNLEQTEALLRRALADPERGYGERRIDISDEALAHLAASVADRRLYDPSDQGYEAEIKERVRRWRGGGKGDE